MAKKTGGHAFPQSDLSTGGSGGSSSTMQGFGRGMSLRDYFAAQAMIGIMSTAGGFDRADRRHGMVSEQAFKFADAMLAEREKE